MKGFREKWIDPNICLVYDTYSTVCAWECFWWWFFVVSFCSCWGFLFKIIHSQLIYGRQKSILHWCVQFNCFFFFSFTINEYDSFCDHIQRFNSTGDFQKNVYAQKNFSSITKREKKIILHKSQLFVAYVRKGYVCNGAKFSIRQLKKKKYSPLQSTKFICQSHFVIIFAYINLGSFLIAFQFDFLLSKIHFTIKLTYMIAFWTIFFATAKATWKTKEKR